MKKHVMLDIETTGLVPGCKVLTIGAVVFDRSGVQMDSSYWRMDRLAWDGSFHEDHGTIHWWLGQSADAYDEAFGGTQHPEEALDEFWDWLCCVNPDGVWCKGAAFDFPILNHALKYAGHNEISYKLLRCYRTLQALAGNCDKKFQGTAHNALDDAIQQAHGAVEAMNMLGVG